MGGSAAPTPRRAATDGKGKHEGLAQTRDQCEGYYYSFMSKRAQRQGGALRGDKSRVGIRYLYNIYRYAGTGTDDLSQGAARIASPSGWVWGLLSHPL